jgi:hypothetical protein
VVGKLGELSPEERQEWKEIQLNQLRQRQKAMKGRRYRESKPWREAVRVFVSVCAKAASKYSAN